MSRIVPTWQQSEIIENLGKFTYNTFVTITARQTMMIHGNMPTELQHCPLGTRHWQYIGTRLVHRRSWSQECKKERKKTGKGSPNSQKNTITEQGKEEEITKPAKNVQKTTTNDQLVEPEAPKELAESSTKNNKQKSQKTRQKAKK